MIGTFYTAIGAGSSGRVPVVDISTNGKNHRTFFLKADGTVLVSGLLNYTCGVGELGYTNNWKPKNKFFQDQYWSYAEVPPYVHELLWDPEDPTVIEFPHSMVAHYDVFTTTGIKASETEKTVAKINNAKVANTPMYVMASPEETLTGIKQVKTCNTHTLFLKRDGTVLICGKLKFFTTITQASNPYVPDSQERYLTPEERVKYPIYVAHTDDPSKEYSLYPTQVYDSKGLKLTNIVSVEATAGGSYFVKDDGSVWGIGIVTGLGNRDKYTPEIPKNADSLIDLLPDGIEDQDKNLDKYLDGSKDVAPFVEKIYASSILTKLRNEDGDFIKNVIEVKSTGNSVFFITNNQNQKIVYAGGFNNRGEFGIEPSNPDYNPYSKNKTDLQYNGTLEGYSRPDYALRALHTYCPWTSTVWKDKQNSPNLIINGVRLTSNNTHWPLGTADEFVFNRITTTNINEDLNNNGLTVANSFCNLYNYWNQGGIGNIPITSRRATIKEDYCGLGYSTIDNYKYFYLSRSIFPPKFELVKTAKLGGFQDRIYDPRSALIPPNVDLIGNSLTYETKGAYPVVMPGLPFLLTCANTYRGTTGWPFVPFADVFKVLQINSLFIGKYEYNYNTSTTGYEPVVLVPRSPEPSLSKYNFSASRRASYKQPVQTYSILPNWASLAFHDQNERSGINSTFLGAIQNSPGLITIPTVNKCLRSTYDVMVDGGQNGVKTLYTRVSEANMFRSPDNQSYEYPFRWQYYSFEQELINPNHNKRYIARNEELVFPLPYNETFEQKTNYNIPFVFDVINKKADTIFSRNYISSNVGHTWETNPISKTSLYGNNAYPFTDIKTGLHEIISAGVRHFYSTPTISQLNLYSGYNLTNNLTSLSSFDIGTSRAANVNKILRNCGTNVTFGSWEYAVQEAQKTKSINWNSTEQKRNSVMKLTNTTVTPLCTDPSYFWQTNRQSHNTLTLDSEHNEMAAWSIKQNPCIWMYTNHAEKVNRFSYDDYCSIYMLSSYPVGWTASGFPFSLTKWKADNYNNTSMWNNSFLGGNANFIRCWTFTNALTSTNWTFLTLTDFLSNLKPEDVWSYYGEPQNARSHLEKSPSASPTQRPEFYIRGFYNLPTKLPFSFDKVVSFATGWYCNWDSFFADIRQYMEPQWVHPYYYDYSLHALENYTNFDKIPGYGPRTTYNRNHTTWFLSGGVPRAFGTNESGQWGNNFVEGVNVPLDPDTYNPLTDIVDIAITTRVSPWMNRIHNALETNFYDYKLAYGEKALLNSNSNVIIPNFDNNYYKDHANSDYTAEELYRWWALASYKKGYITLSKLQEIFSDNNSMDVLTMGLDMLESPFSEANQIQILPYTRDDKIVLNYQQNEECLVYELALNDKRGFISLPTRFRNLTGCQLFSETDLTKLNATLADVADLVRQKRQGVPPVVYQNIEQFEEKTFTVIPLISSSLGKTIQQQTINWITLKEGENLFYTGNLASDTVFYRELKAAGTEVAVPYPTDNIVYTLGNPIINSTIEIKTNCNLNLSLEIYQQVITTPLTLSYNFFVALFNEAERITDQITISPICWDFNYDEYPEYQYILNIVNGLFTNNVEVIRSQMTTAHALRLNYWLPVSYSLNNKGHTHFGSSTYFLKQDGTVLSCGSNEQGQLGYGYKGGYGTGIGNNPFSVNMSETTKFGKVPLIHSKPSYVLDPTGLKRLQNIVKIYAAYDVVYFINNVGEVYSCGANYFGEQGTGSNAINSQSSFLPSKVLI